MFFSSDRAFEDFQVVFSQAILQGFYEFPYTKHLQNLKQQVTERRIPLPGTYLVICGQSEMKNKTES